jgi:hypothetical protein
MREATSLRRWDSGFREIGEDDGDAVPYQKGRGAIL